MKRSILSLFALAAFAFTFAGTALNDYLDGEVRWFYAGTLTPLPENVEPDCASITNDICAQQYQYDAEHDEWKPLTDESNIARGVRNMR